MDNISLNSTGVRQADVKGYIISLLIWIYWKIYKLNLN